MSEITLTPANPGLKKEYRYVTEPKIITGEDYINSLRGRGLIIYLFDELVKEPTDHPMIRPSINAMAATYDLALKTPELAAVTSPFTGEKISRFLHICTDVDDLVNQNKMQRKLGHMTGTCFQRCVGMDAFNALYSVTYEMDEPYRTEYHARIIEFLTRMHRGNLVVGGAMTDVKGDRSLGPHEQADPDMYVHVCKSGVGDVLIGAAASVADMNGVAKTSHIKDKLVEMTHLNETVYAVRI